MPETQLLSSSLIAILDLYLQHHPCVACCPMYDMFTGWSPASTGKERWEEKPPVSDRTVTWLRYCLLTTPQPRAQRVCSRSKLKHPDLEIDTSSPCRYQGCMPLSYSSWQGRMQQLWAREMGRGSAASCHCSSLLHGCSTRVPNADFTSSWISLLSTGTGGFSIKQSERENFNGRDQREA